MPGIRLTEDSGQKQSLWAVQHHAPPLWDSSQCSTQQSRGLFGSSKLAQDGKLGCEERWIWRLSCLEASCSTDSMKPKAMVSAPGNYSSLIVPSGLHAVFSVIIFTTALSPSNTADTTRFLGNRPRKLTKGQILMTKRKRFCYHFAHRHRLCSFFITWFFLFLVISEWHSPFIFINILFIRGVKCQ